MQTDDYESLTYKLKFRRACKTALIVLAICLVVIAPALWCWDQSIQKRQALRDAKNVVLNLELLAMEQYGYGRPIQDFGRPSGMTKHTEKMVRDFAAVDGNISLTAFDKGESRVLRMSYQKGKYLVEYQYDESEDSSIWNIYWKIR